MHLFLFFALWITWECDLEANLPILKYFISYLNLYIEKGQILNTNNFLTQLFLQISLEVSNVVKI